MKKTTELSSRDSKNERTNEDYQAPKDKKAAQPENVNWFTYLLLNESYHLTILFVSKQPLVDDEIWTRM